MISLVTRFYYDVNNNLIVIFFMSASHFQYLIIGCFRILWEHNFFALLVLNSRRSGDSSLGFKLVAFRPQSRQTIKLHISGPQRQQHRN